jgi:ketosteroid isomerase-like protein
MERLGRDTHVSPSDETVPIETERTVPAPRFDQKSIQSARPAVPLEVRQAARRRAGPAAFVVLCVVAGLVGGMLGALALSYYLRNNSRPAVASATDAEAPPAPNASDAAAGQTVGAQTPPAPAATEAGPEAQAPGAQIVEGPDTTPDADAVAPDADSRAALRGALDEWIAATNARDLSKQMSFYNSRVNSFYLSRNASREAVRAEKARVLGRAETIDVRASEPDIRLSRDGRTATMRFRKKYSITGGADERRGEVLQELRWQRTGDGWKIVSERDLRVLR